MNQPISLVSVVIPSYNRADVVGRAVTSVLDQPVDGLELIVVDDGSTDATRDVLASFDDARLTLLSSDHLGAAAARNLGARRARARWLTFLDSDDAAQPDWLPALLAEASTPGTALVSCGYVERIEGSDVVRRRSLPRRASPSVGPMVELISTGGTYLVLREVFLDTGGFDPEQPAAQHQELALRLGPLLTERGLQSRAVMRPLVDRWVGRDDHIRSNDRAVFEGTVRLLELHTDRLALDPPFMADIAATGAYRAVRLGKIEDARRLMWLAARTQPRKWRHWARLAGLIVPGMAKRHVTQQSDDLSTNASAAPE